jgi:hypothetical membrane protein
VTRVPWWVLAAAASAPVLLIGGWSIAERLQPTTYSPARDTISFLAGRGATDPWVMTAAIAALGACYVIAASGLPAVTRAGRLVLAIGGIATILVSALPLPHVGTSQSHGLAAAVGFVALTIWPLATLRRNAPQTPWALRAPAGIAAGAVLIGFVTWFGVSLLSHDMVGVSERAAAAAESLWPLIVVISIRAAVPAAVQGEAVRSASPVTSDSRRMR